MTTTGKTTLKVGIDRERCAGHGRCYVFAPEVFEPDDEGFAVTLDGTPAEREHDAVLKAQRNCPEQAVIVTDSSKDVVAE